LKVSTLTPIVYNQALGQTVLYAAQPMINDQGRVIGVPVSRARVRALETILGRRSGLGETGETYLVTNDHVLAGGLAATTTRVGVPLGRASKARQQAALEGQVTGSSVYENYRNRAVVGVYRYITEIQAVLLTEQERSESARAAYAVLAVNASVALSSIIVALFLALMTTRSIADPVAELASLASGITADTRRLLETTERPDGEAVVGSQVAAVGIAGRAAGVVPMAGGRYDEIGRLGQAFEAMTGQVNALIASLEQRIGQRTAQLEQRTRFLEASAEVSRAAGLFLEVDSLVEQAVELIREGFDLYYVGLFLLDEGREWAVLRAATGQAGQALLERGHRLAVRGPAAGTSMIAWSINNAQARVAQEAVRDVVRFATPELPETQSEVALPLRSRGQVLGAISVQSRQVNAFDAAGWRCCNRWLTSWRYRLITPTCLRRGSKRLKLNAWLTQKKAGVCGRVWRRARGGVCGRWQLGPAKVRPGLARRPKNDRNWQPLR
jgi:putative methionine-R-sulfoxide reductase with GAF domain